MKSKILFTASIAYHFKAFHLPYLKWLQDQGFETHVACNTIIDLPFVDKVWDVPFARNPFAPQNIRAYLQLKKIIDRENYLLINCHTPAASVITRLAAIDARKLNTKLIYTAHGFHFFKGAPLKYWVLFFPVEKFLTQMTDAVITINSEDFNLIKKTGSKKANYFLIPGIGVNRLNFHPVEINIQQNLRKEKNISLHKKILIYSAEFIPRKNHQFIIESVASYPETFQNMLILFAGKGKDEIKLVEKVNELKLNHIIKFIGFRTDIDEIYKLSDIGISSSKQEGLGLNLVEEMMCGLPLIATEDRGHKEIISHNKNGLLFPQSDKKAFANAVQKLVSDPGLYQRFRKNAIIDGEKFELSKSLRAVTAIYKQYI